MIVPTPVKPAIHPERLVGESANGGHGVLNNASYRAFIDQLRRDGVLVFDAARPDRAHEPPRGAGIPRHRHALAA